MANSEQLLMSDEQTQSAKEFIAVVAPMTANSGQIEILRDLGGIGATDSLLEIWCGGGDLTAQLATLAGRVTGADYSTKLIEAARARHPDLDFAASDAVELGFDDETFDVVVSNFTAHHYDDPARTFGETRRVLKAGGRLLVTMPVQSKRVGFNIVLEAAREHLDLPAKVVTGGPLIDAEEVDEVARVLTQAGFGDVRGVRRVHHARLESIETLLQYAWTKLELSTASADLQAEIRGKALERAAPFLGADGAYSFPDTVLAVRATK